MHIQENVLLSEKTTMRLGGPADFFISIESADDVRDAFDFANDKNLPVYFLGTGANAIGLDSGFPGVILHSQIMGLKVLTEDKDTLTVQVGGGVAWDDFVAWTVEKGFSGAELLSYIPGSVAAAPVQNIGAYGAEAAEIITSVSAYDALLDEYVEIPAKDCDFSYRHSIFNSGETKGRYFILSVTFRLTKTQKTPPFYNSLQTYLNEHGISDYSPKHLRAAVIAIRRAKLPDPAKEPSAGSFFKNIYVSAAESERLKAFGISSRPDRDGQSKVNTARVLELAGVKGKLFHGFEVSDKAPLVLINRSATSSEELAAAVADIKQIVQEKFNLTLEQEPELIREPLHG